MSQTTNYTTPGEQSTSQVAMAAAAESIRQTLRRDHSTNKVMFEVRVLTPATHSQISVTIPAGTREAASSEREIVAMEAQVAALQVENALDYDYTRDAEIRALNLRLIEMRSRAPSAATGTEDYGGFEVARALKEQGVEFIFTLTGGV